MMPDTTRMSDWSEAIGASLEGGDAAFDGVFTDSRAPRPGAVFVALRGPRFDGHGHVQAAMEAGAVGAMVETIQPVALPQWRVDDTRAGLGRLGTAWRQAWPGRLGALTGSNGKTTVKEMVAAILGEMGPALATEGNLNNDIGVPLTLLRLRPEHQRAVVEMGANHPGEIAALTELARPEVGMVTNAGPAHLEGFGDVPGVAKAKGELFAGLPAGGTAVINCDDRFAEQWRQQAGHCAVLGFGRDAAADVRVQGEQALADGGQALVLATPVGPVATSLPLPGAHNALNAAAAAAMAIALGAEAEEVATGLARVRAVGGRLDGRPGRNGARIIDDSYNANPGSLAAGVAVLAALPGRRLLVLGDMGELGDGARRWHREAGNLAREAGVDAFYGIGPLAAEAVDGFGTAGHHFEQADTLAEAVAAELDNNTTVLVKGSRAMGLDRVVAHLTGARGEH